MNPIFVTPVWSLGWKLPIASRKSAGDLSGQLYFLNSYDYNSKQNAPNRAATPRT
jgi:hypothetical protein